MIFSHTYLCLDAFIAKLLQQIIIARLYFIRVVIVSPDDSVLAATKKMLELKISSAVITVENKPRGILT